SCSEFRNACSNLIFNQAFASYTGEINKAKITDDPSVIGFNECKVAEAGTTNFLADIADCVVVNDVELCGSTSNLEDGLGFDNYQWFRKDESGNWTLISEENSNNYNAPGYGEYKVTKSKPGCISFDEFFNVIPRSNNPESPFS